MYILYIALPSYRLFPSAYPWGQFSGIDPELVLPEDPELVLPEA
jgi:hypothetical protein